MDVCSVNGCDRLHKSHGYCAAHVNRWLRHGDPLAHIPIRGAHGKEPTDERFQRYVVEKPNGCWEWTGWIDVDGYGGFRNDNGTSCKAHRWSYEYHRGPIAPGLTIDHLCRNRRCVNPEHLEVVTIRVNVLRGDTLPARNAAATHCCRGHAFTPDNTYVDPKSGKRACRTCRRMHQRQRQYIRIGDAS